MRIWFDTEFIEDGKTIDLISIGAVREDGRQFYAENAECDLGRASPWVVAHVFPHLSSGQNPYEPEEDCERFCSIRGREAGVLGLLRRL